MKKPELLAPAGDMECLYAAIEAGCDAVYLGGKLFGARAFASNFSNEEMVEAINYSHLYGVKVYVTLNTIVYESEVETFMKYVDFLVNNGVDALIMQDLGMIDLVHETYPSLEIHGSTQMHIHNKDGVEIASKIGLKRVVLARELSLDTIFDIRKNSTCELEVFIHGALCISYSGQCLMSSLIGSRSGNRGTCAQCCRMEYDVVCDNKKVGKYKYPLSTKDLCTIETIPFLIDIGVDSLKIEGRMKRKEYVYLVTSLYRKAIDSYIEFGRVNISNSDIDNLKVMFNREFTKGFFNYEENNNYTNPIRPNHMGVTIGKVIGYNKGIVSIKLDKVLNKEDGIRIIGKEDIGCTVVKMFKNKKLVNGAYKGDIIDLKIDGVVNIGDKVVKTTDKNLIDEINNKLKNKSRKICINGKLYCYKGENLQLEVSDGKNIVNIKSSYIVEKSINNSTSYERIKEQLNKVGNTIYKFDTIDILGDTNIFISIKELNELRRCALLELDKKRCSFNKIEKCKYSLELKEIKDDIGFNVLIENYDQYEDVKDKDYKNIYIDDKKLFNDIADDRLILKLPRVRNESLNYNQELLVGELGSLKYNNVITDFSFNVVNSYSVALLHSVGAKRVTLSYELSDKQIENIIISFRKRYKINPNLELIVSSYPESMVCKYNLYKQYNYDSLYLKDKFNNLFRVKDNKDFMTIYHFSKINLDNYQFYFDMGINRLRIHV